MARQAKRPKTAFEQRGFTFAKLVFGFGGAAVAIGLIWLFRQTGGGEEAGNFGRFYLIAGIVAGLAVIMGIDGVMDLAKGKDRR